MKFWLTLALGLLTSLPTAAGTVLITGSNRGIGLGLVKQYIERDWQVIATARRPKSASDLQELARGYSKLHIERLDVTDQPQIDALARKYQGQTIDVLINNAGYVPPFSEMLLPFDKLNFDNAERVFAVNTFGTLRVTQALMPSIEQSNNGRIREAPLHIALPCREQIARMHRHKGKQCRENGDYF